MNGQCYDIWLRNIRGTWVLYGCGCDELVAKCGKCKLFRDFLIEIENTKGTVEDLILERFKKGMVYLKDENVL